MLPPPSGVLTAPARFLEAKPAKQAGLFFYPRMC